MGFHRVLSDPGPNMLTGHTSADGGCFAPKLCRPVFNKWAQDVSLGVHLQLRMFTVVIACDRVKLLAMDSTLCEVAKCFPTEVKGTNCQTVKLLL